MKTDHSSFFPTAALAVGAFLLFAPNVYGAETKTTLNSADRKFIQKEAAAGGALVKVAELGVKKAERADIKAFAEMMVADHTKANAELAALAQSKSVELTTEVDSKDADTHAKLESETGPNFDKEFLSVITKSHKRCVKNFEKAAEDAEDSQVKMWAGKMLPALQSHLEKAEALSSTPNVTTSTTPNEKTTTEPDNTARNVRDRDAKTLTPLDQGNSKADIDTTAQIRKEIMSLEDLSVNAQNVKIITNKGHVTLRGPVNSVEEKRLIGDIANRAATSEHVDNQLEIKGVNTAE